MITLLYRRVYIEVVTTESLDSRESVDNMLFQLSEGLRTHTAIVQLHVVDRAETLGQIAAGADLIPEGSRAETPSAGSSSAHPHAGCLYQACVAMGMPKGYRGRN